MINPKFFEEINQKITEAFANSPLGGPLKDAEKNLKAVMLSIFSKMDLVTREEFDVQRDLLTRAQERIAALETRIATLEVQNKTPSNS